jgi:hypothetical protein
VPGDADANVYAYVSGRALAAIDPLGLDGGLVGSQKTPQLPSFGDMASAAAKWLKYNFYAGHPVGQSIALVQMVDATVKTQPYLDKCKSGGCGANDVKHLEGMRNDMAVGVGVGVVAGAAMAAAPKVVRPSTPRAPPKAADVEAVGAETVRALEGPAATDGVLQTRAGLVDVFRARARQQGGFADSGTPIILDENMAGRGLAEALRARGFNVRDIKETFGETGVKDPKIREAAEVMGARVLTRDRGRQPGEGFGESGIQVDQRVGTDADALSRILSQTKGVERMEQSK